MLLVHVADSNGFVVAQDEDYDDFHCHLNVLEGMNYLELMILKIIEMEEKLKTKVKNNGIGKMICAANKRNINNNERLV